MGHEACVFFFAKIIALFLEILWAIGAYLSPISFELTSRKTLNNWWSAVDRWGNKLQQELAARQICRMTKTCGEKS